MCQLRMRVRRKKTSRWMTNSEHRSHRLEIDECMTYDIHEAITSSINVLLWTSLDLLLS